MAESLFIPTGSKNAVYQALIPQIKALIEHEADLIANLANIAAVLTAAFHHHWIGFYITRGDDLVLGPFQGPLACTRIPLRPIAKGVCGAAAQTQKTIIVPDVEQFPGHIACSSLSRSEIVVPLVAHGTTQLVLDIDSSALNAFDGDDQTHLENLIALIQHKHFA